MKTIGIQIKTNEIILVVLKQEAEGEIGQTAESDKFRLPNSDDPIHVKRFRDQINSALDLIAADKIAIISRNPKAKGNLAPSPISFKLEGIIQLYEGTEVMLVSPLTTNAYFKKKLNKPKSKHVYQQDAFDMAYYIMHK